ncbi:MAG: DNA recombination protein RmuC [Candidatus Acidiferrales bacterium]|jgi:DNA recombination protein RmuC
MEETTFVAAIGLAGILIGVIIGYVVTSLRTKTALEKYTLQSYGNTRILESTATELRNKVAEMKNLADSKGREISQMQEQLRAEAEQRVAAQTELRDTRASLDQFSAVREQLLAEARSRAVAESKLSESQNNFEMLRKSLEDAEVRMVDAFNALSSSALRNNNEAFMTLAQNAFESIQTRAAGSLDTRQQAIEGLVTPLRDALDRYENQIRELERTRQNAYGSLEQQLSTLASSNLKLQHETGSLATALRTPQVRGRWGDMTLRRSAELAGMSAHCDFIEQTSFENGERLQRPDMIVNLPGGRRIAVDAKVPLQAFLDAASAQTEEQRFIGFSKHAQLVRAHMNQLASRDYWQQLEPAPEFVVLFLPGESLFASAVEQDRTLMEDGMEKKVILATPATLIALMRAAAFGWRQDAVAKNSEDISDLGRQLHERIRAFITHFEDMGASLRGAVDRFNDARASLESGVLPAARQFRDLNAANGAEIPEISVINDVPGSVAAPEVQAAASNTEEARRARAAGGSAGD